MSELKPHELACPRCGDDLLRWRDGVLVLYVCDACDEAATAGIWRILREYQIAMGAAGEAIIS
jgi:hypothetical protein